MNKIIRLIQAYLLWSAPLTLTCMIWYTLNPTAHGTLYDILSGNLVLWFAALVAFLALLVLVRFLLRVRYNLKTTEAQISLNPFV